MHRPVGFFLAVAVLVVAAWWWLGSAVSMPPSPLQAGEKLNCVSYSPYRGWQTPLNRSQRMESWQIDEDLALLSKVSDCVRIYSVQDGWEQVPELARRHGLDVLLGIWVSNEAEPTRRQIEAGIALANQYSDIVRAVIVGNETLLRREVTAAHLASLITTVKKQVSVPVTYADVWEFWLQNPELAKVTDFVTIHILPYWEDHPIPASTSGAHISSIRQRVAETFPGKEVLIGEVGWPSAGRMRWGALPSRSNQAQVLHEVLHRSKAEGFDVNIIEAFDQPWKRILEGTVGGHWGLLTDPPREAKFAWGQPVSNHPFWIWQALGGIVLAAGVFGAALATTHRREAVGPESVIESEPDNGPRNGTWLAISAVAAVSGVLIGYTVEAALFESLGLGGWLRGAALIGIALVGPLLVAAAIARRMTIPAFVSVLGPAAERVGGALERALGWLVIATTILCVQAALGLTFNPRYLDFPFAPLTAVLVPLLVLSMMTPRLPGIRPRAEIAVMAVIAPCAVFILWNETLQNWQALWFVAMLALLVVILARVRAAPGSTAAA